MADIKKVPVIRFKGFNEEWIDGPLGEAVEFFSGLTYSPKDVVDSDGTLVLRSSNVINGEIVNADDVFVNSEVVNCDNVRAGDIAVVVRNGSRSLIGKHAQIKRKMNNTVIGAFMTGIRSEQPNFINVLLDTQQFNKEVEKNLGATINQITTSAFKKMQFSVPDPTEQTQIGSYFQNLDKLISLHQAKVDKLVNLKKAMLEKMFPKDGANVPEIRFKGFELAWEEKNITELGQIFIGLVTTMTKYYRESGALLIRNSDIKNNHFKFADSPIFLDEQFANDNSNRKLQIGDVVTVHTGEAGTSAVIAKREEGSIGFATINTRPNKKIIDSNYLSTFLNTDTHKYFAIKMSTGDGRTNYNLGDFFKLVVPLPKLEEQKKVGSYFQNLDKLIFLHQTELDKLNNLKKACLEKMFV
ncbi:restriction endonuclease subunit S [Nitrosomonas sp. Is35]|uniref:restriction endonuclease subunit S n=1 Tax=Nitrosomonas sp. Is35 TaxID=3080534 RepID=UPI00294B0B64|nr:restriction endonuclease subunit S [Nitrosomonas sp. Is35]MDV6345902.1 restriction endonuclease subunit S [Nitrosomonas sp. Is35]